VLSGDRNKRWREANPDKVRAARLRWQRANREKVNANSRRWREENPDRNTEPHKKYYEKGARNKENHCRHWTQEDVGKILAPDRPADLVLAAELGQTVKAIEMKRYETVRLP